MQVEKLIQELPSVPADWLNGDVNLAEKNFITNGTSLQHVENGTNLRDTQSMLLERIASEMNRLKFYIAHAQVAFALPCNQFLLHPILNILSCSLSLHLSWNSIQTCRVFILLSFSSHEFHICWFLWLLVVKQCWKVKNLFILFPSLNEAWERCWRINYVPREWSSAAKIFHIFI